MEISLVIEKSQLFLFLFNSNMDSNSTTTTHGKDEDDPQHGREQDTINYNDMFKWENITRENSLLRKGTLHFSHFFHMEDTDVENMKCVRVVQSLPSGRIFCKCNDLCREIFRDMYKVKALNSFIDKLIQYLGITYRPFLDKRMESSCSAEECSVCYQYWDGTKHTVIAIEWCNFFIEQFFERACYCGFFDTATSCLLLKRKHALKRMEHFKVISKELILHNKIPCALNSPFSLKPLNTKTMLVVVQSSEKVLVPSNEKQLQVDIAPSTEKQAMGVDIVQSTEKKLQVEKVSSMGNKLDFETALNKDEILEKAMKAAEAKEAAEAETEHGDVNLRVTKKKRKSLEPKQDAWVKNQKRLEHKSEAWIKKRAENREARKKRRQEDKEAVLRFSNGRYSKAQPGGVCPFRVARFGSI